MMTYRQRLDESAASWFARMQSMQRRLITLVIAAAAAGLAWIVGGLA